MEDRDKYQTVKGLFERWLGKSLNKDVSLIQLLNFSKSGRYTVMEGEKSNVYRLPLLYTITDKETGKVEDPKNEMWILKIYDRDRIEPKFVRREVEIANLIHTKNKDLVPNVLGFHTVKNETYLLMDYLGPKTLGKHYIAMDDEEKEVLWRVSQRERKKGDEEILAWLKFMNFIYEDNGVFEWDPSTADRFRINNGRLVESDDFYKQQIRALEAAIDTKHKVEALMNNELKDQIREMIKGDSKNNSTEEFFKRFEYLADFADLHEKYLKEKDELVDLFIKIIGNRREAEEGLDKKLILGNCYLMNFIQKDGNPESSNDSVVKVTDLYHVTEGHWLYGDIDIVGVASAQHGLSENGIRSLWHYVWSRAASDNLVADKEHMPLDLKVILTLERLGFFVSTACRQLTYGQDKLTLGSRRQRLRTVRDKSDFLMRHLDHYLRKDVVKEGGERIDSGEIVKTRLFTEKFLRMYRKYFEKINKKSKKFLSKKGGR